MSTDAGDPTKGVIESVTGRADGRGFPEVHEAVLRLGDGSVLETRMPPLKGDERTFHRLPFDFTLTEFDACPICLDPSATSAEHVPPSSIGGRTLTYTCERCNNEFGSKYEPHLLTWYEGSLGQVRVSGADVRGQRHAGQYLLRETTDGKFVLFQHGKADPAVDPIIRSGEFNISFPEQDLPRVRIAMIKSAYLAACVLMGTIATGPRAQAVREALHEARDYPRHGRIALPEPLESIEFARSQARPKPGEIALMGRDTDEGQRFVIGFNRVFAVDWPLDDIAVGYAPPPPATDSPDG